MLSPVSTDVRNHFLKTVTAVTTKHIEIPQAPRLQDILNPRAVSKNISEQEIFSGRLTHIYWLWLFTYSWSTVLELKCHCDIESWKIHVPQIFTFLSSICFSRNGSSCKSRTAMDGSTHQNWLCPQAGSQSSCLQRTGPWDGQTVCGWTFHTSLCSWSMEECLQHQ